MNFLVLSAQQEPSPLLSLPTDRLVLRATRESRERDAADAARRHLEEEKRRRRKRGHKRHRSPEHSYTEAAAAAGRNALRISGTLLRSLCLAEAQRACPPARAEVWMKDTEHLSCVVAHTVPEVTLQAGLRIVFAADMAEYRFDVQTELLVRGRLLVFTSWGHLAEVAVPPRFGRAPPPQLLASALQQQQQQHRYRQEQLQRDEDAEGGEVTDKSRAAGNGASTGPMDVDSAETGAKGEKSHAATTAAGRHGSHGAFAAGDTGGGKTSVTTTPPQTAEKRQRPGSDARTGGSATAPSTPGSGGSAWSGRYPRHEAVRDVVPAHTTSEDIRDLNELIEVDVISVDTVGPELASFLCRHCRKLPVVTLTVSCCGALLCPRCLPTPPTVFGAPVEERLCPVCGEEPLHPPESHAHRDHRLSQLVKELKVLYHPHVRALRRRNVQGEVKRSPDVKGGGQLFMMDTSSIGLL